MQGSLDALLNMLNNLHWWGKRARKHLSVGRLVHAGVTGWVSDGQSKG